MRQPIGPAIWLAVSLIVCGAGRASAQDSRAAMMRRNKRPRPRSSSRITNKAEQLFVTLQREMLQEPNGYPLFGGVYSGGGFTLVITGGSTAIGPTRHQGHAYSGTTSSWSSVRFVGPCGRTVRSARGPDGATPRRSPTGLGMDGPERPRFRDAAGYVGGGVAVHPVPWTVFRGALTYEDFTPGQGAGKDPSIEEVNTPATAPGPGANPAYLHAMASAGIDTRLSPGYARRGGLYEVSYHNYADRDDTYSFDRLDAEVVQHIPILRENWVISLHGLLQTTLDDADTVPYFLLPSLGSGSTLRAYSSWRFRDRHSLLMSAEWRWIPSRLGLDMALFYDTGKVTPEFRDISWKGLASDVGIGVRFHGPLATPLRIELAKGREGLHLVFSGSAAF